MAPPPPPSRWNYSTIDPRVGPDTEGRYRFVVSVHKIPYEERTVARRVMATEEDAAARAFLSVYGADTDDEDPRHPVGSEATYVLRLTPAEADEFWAVGQRSGGNLRWMELDQARTRPPRPYSLPGLSSIDPPAGGGLIGGLSMSGSDGGAE